VSTYVHHDPVQDCARDGSQDLSGESGAGWKLGILGELEILQHEQALDHGVGGVEREHHVCNWATRNHVPSYHLHSCHRLVVKSRDGEERCVKEK